MSSFRITLDPENSNQPKVIQDIKDAVERTPLPGKAEEPGFWSFSNAEKAIIDVAIYHTGTELLDAEKRAELQKYALAFETQLLTLPQISSVERQGYLQPEIQILIRPERLTRFNVPLSEVRRQILAQHVRLPAGVMEDRRESEISVVSEFETPESLKNVVVRSGFEGNRVLLGQLDDIRYGFEKTQTISKIQGHEGVILNV